MTQGQAANQHLNMLCIHSTSNMDILHPHKTRIHDSLEFDSENYPELLLLPFSDHACVPLASPQQLVPVDSEHKPGYHYTHTHVHVYCTLGNFCLAKILQILADCEIFFSEISRSTCGLS